MATFSFEEAAGLSAEGKEEKKPIVFADRTASPRKKLQGPTLSDDGVDHIAQLKALGSKFAGTVTTSLRRTPEHNRRVGGKPNSQHLTGTAGDFVVPKEHRTAFRQEAERMGYQVIDEGDHYHVQRRRGSKSASAPVTGSSDQGPKPQAPKKSSFSFEDAWGGKAPAQGATTPQTPEAPEPEGLGYILGGLKNAGNILAQKAEDSWNYIQQRITDRPDQFLGQQVTTMQRTPQELDRLMQEERDSWSRFLPDVDIPLPDFIERMKEQEIAGRRESRRNVQVVDESGKSVPVQEAPKAGFWANIKNPAALLTEDSLPANIIEYIANAPAEEGRNFMKARQALKEEEIVANPHKYSGTQVEAARAAVNERKKKQSAGVADAWHDLKQAAKEDPGRFGAQLLNSIVADPEMMLAPVGTGVKVVGATRAAATLGRAGRIADKVIDAGSTAAALNMSMGLAHAGSEGEEYTAGQAKTDLITGFVLGGTLGTIFGKSAKAKASLRNGEVTADTLDNILKDVAKEELVTEDIIRSTSPINRSTKHQIEEATGIKFESDADLKTYLETSRKEWRQLFKDRDLHGQYQEALANERMERRSVLAGEAAEREAAGQAEAAKQQSVEAAYAERQAQRTERFQQEYDAALQAREAARQGEVNELFARDEKLKEVSSQLDEQEIFEAAFDGDVPAIRNAMQRAVRRDNQLRMPKWQRGEADPRLIARLGVASLFAGTAYATVEKENKNAAAFGAALAGLLAPGAGGQLARAGRKFRELGAITPEGDIVGLLAKEGKLKLDKTTAEVKARDTDLVKRLQEGDQQAFKTIYDEYYPEVKRFVRNMTRDSGPRLGIEPDDIAQEAFIKAYQNIGQFRGDAALSTWLKTIARNEGLQAIRQAKNLREGGEFIFESAELPDVRTAYGESYSRDAFDEGAGSHIEDTPENQMARQQAEKRLTIAIEALPEAQRKVFILKNIEQYTLQEISDMLDTPVSTLHERLDVAQKKVLTALERMGSANKRMAQNPVVDDTISVWRVPKTGMNASTEGAGMYASASRDMASQFGNPEEFKVPRPKKPLIVNEEPLYQLQELDDIFDPIKASDSTWLKLNKAAADVTMEQTGDPRQGNAEQFSQLFGDNLTEAARHAGYDAFDIRSGGEQWYVLFDGHKNAVPAKRGRGRPPGSKNKPKGQEGFVDEKLMKVLGASTVGALAGYTIADKNKTIGALAGAGMGILLFGGAKQVGKFADDLYGASSTRILNKSPAIHRRILTTERRILEHTHKHIENVEPFIKQLNRLPKETANVVARALMTGRADVIDRLFKALDNPEFTNSYKQVRASLDSLGDKLVHLKRFKRGNMEYFPRIVKDKEGLFKAIGKQESDSIQAAIQDANVKSLRENGRPISEIEESAIINQMLFADKRGVQPGFTKNRGIEEITPELQQYYAKPGESLHSYIRSAVQDIEAAEFFGHSAINMKNGPYEFIDVDRSVKNLIAEDVKAGRLSNEDAHEVADILRTRFKEGLRGEADIIRNFKNLGNIGLLGNIVSAASQLADVGIQTYVQGLRPTIESVIRQVSGKKIVDMKDFGLADHISEEFAGELRTSRWVRNVFKTTLFSGIDKFGKNTALNAAIIKAKQLVQTDKGIERLANKYQESFGPDFPKLISDLKGGRITDLTRDMAFMELSRTQPISRIEMPQAYLKHPNLRSYLWLKSFMMKQMDLVRRDAYNEIKKGNVAKGVKNLTQIAVALGVSGATTDMVKDWLRGRDVSISASDIAENMFKTFGFSEYTRDKFTGVSKEEAQARRDAGDTNARARAPAPIEALASTFFIPPYKQYEQALRGDTKALSRLVPYIGPYLAEKLKQSEEMKEEALND